MLAKYLVVWYITSVFLITATTTTERPQGQGGSCVHGGRPLQPGESPFLVLLEVAKDDKTARCSGSIPSPTTVLTASHCYGDNITAYAGVVSSKEKELRNGQAQVRRVESKASYYPDDYGIMICFVNQSWEWTEFVAPVALQVSDGSPQPSFVTSCQVVGFGQTEPDGESSAMHVMDQLVGSGSQCEEQFTFYSFYPYTDFFYTYNFFCSYYMCSVNVENKTMCGEHPGGLVLCGGQQWAISLGEDSRVRDPDELTVLASRYLHVAFFRTWIQNKIKDLPSSADSILHCSVKISMYTVLLSQPLLLVL